MNQENFITEELTLNTNPGVMLSFELNADLNTIDFLKDPENGDIKIIDNKVQYISNENFTGIESLIIDYKRQGQSVILNVNIKVGYSFRAKSHILSLLGDQLIGSDNLAIFELVKNAYDADAKEVKITFENLNTPDQAIIVEDNGIGMTLDTLKNVWLEIGTDFKRGGNRKASTKFDRISLGEKGVGRLAVHKLGKSIILETQPEGSKKSYRLSLNWQKLIDDNDYIDETSVEIKTLQEDLFEKGNGTRLIIKELKKENWSRGELRELARKVISIISPFKEVKGTFNVIIDAKEKQEWIEDIKSVDTLLDDSLYYFDFSLKKNDKLEFANLTWDYKFNPPPSFELKATIHEQKNDEKNRFSTVFNVKADSPFFEEGQKHLKNSDLDGIGEITGRFYVYNLLAVVLRSFGQTQAIKTFVKENSGVKIFRDGIRVYNYGEPSDDWLGLDLARVQRLGSHFSKNTTIGTVEISQEGSFQDLKEKTNREGFDENFTYLKFKNICSQIFRIFESLAQSDRDKLKDYLDGLRPVKTIGLPETIAELTEKLKKKNIDKEIAPLLQRVEKDYNNMRNVMLNSGMTGINLGIVFHEVDREVKYINADLNKNSNIEIIKQRVKNLIQLLENFSPILKQNTNIVISASQLIEKARQINNPRFGYHKVIFSSPLISGENVNFQISGPGNLLISAVSNIIDNAIYWVSSKRELEGDDFKAGLYIGSDFRNFTGPAIIIADNGDGFSLEPEDLIMPYRTTRPGGMGLGLYFVNLVMEMMGGKLVFPDKEDLEIPKVYNGAILALVFPKQK